MSDGEKIVSLDDYRQQNDPHAFIEAVCAECGNVCLPYSAADTRYYACLHCGCEYWQILEGRRTHRVDSRDA